MNPSNSSPGSAPDSRPALSNRPPASFDDVLTRMENLSARLEKAMEGAKALLARVSAKLDAKPLADSLGNTLRLELNRTAFRETATQISESMSASLPHLEELKRQLIVATEQARAAFNQLDQSARTVPEAAFNITNSIQTLRKLSFAWIFGSALAVGVIVAAALTWEGRGYYRDQYEEKLAKELKIAGANRDAAAELIQTGHQLSTGPVVNSFKLEVGRYLRVSGAHHAYVMPNGDAMVELSATRQVERN